MNAKTTTTTTTNAKLTKKATTAKPAEQKKPEAAKTAPVPAPAALSPATDAGFSVQQLAKEIKQDPYDVRKALRAIEAKKPGTRWVWTKKESAMVLVPKLREWLGLEESKKAAKAKK